MLKSFTKNQENGISASVSKHQEQSKVAGRGYEERDHGYPCMNVEFLRWEDGDPTSWISRARYFFTRTPEASKVKIASNGITGLKPIMDFSPWEQFKGLLVCFGPSKCQKF